MGRVLRHVLGWGCLLLGIAGLVLPVLQGWLLIGVGALLLAPDVPIFARLVCWIERRVPRLKPLLVRWRTRLGRDAAPPCE